MLRRLDMSSILLHASLVVHDLTHLENDQHLISDVLVKQPSVNVLKELAVPIRLSL